MQSGCKVLPDEHHMSSYCEIRSGYIGAEGWALAFLYRYFGTDVEQLERIVGKVGMHSNLFA